MADNVKKSDEIRLFSNLDVSPREGHKAKGVKELTGIFKAFDRVIGTKIMGNDNQLHSVSRSSLEKFLYRNRSTISATNAMKVAFKQDALKQISDGHEPTATLMTQNDENMRYNGNFSTLFAGKKDEEVLNAIKIIPKQYINYCDEHGNTLLSEAVKCGHKEVVKYLLSHNAFLNVANSEGITPLLFAVRNKNQSMINLLLDKGAIVDFSATSGKNLGRTVLYDAASRGDTATVKLLLSRNASPKLASADGENSYIPLYAAIKSGKKETVALFLSKGPVLTSAEKILVQKTIYEDLMSGKRERIEMANFLLSSNLDLDVNKPIENTEGNTLLHAVVEKQNLEAFILLLNKGADPNIKNEQNKKATDVLKFKNLFEGRSSQEMLNAVKKIPKEHLNLVDSDGNRLLDIAYNNGYDDVVKYLIENKATGTLSNGASLLHGYLDSDVVKVDGNKNVFGRRDISMVNFLLKHGVLAEVQNPDRNNATPLHIAIANGDKDMVKLLQPHSKMEEYNDNGFTPLHVAVNLCKKQAHDAHPDQIRMHRKRLDILSFLLSCKPNINIKTEPKEVSGAKEVSLAKDESVVAHTPLYMAMVNDDMDALKLLLNKKAELSTEETDALHTECLASKITGLNCQQFMHNRLFFNK